MHVDCSIVPLQVFTGQESESQCPVRICVMVFLTAVKSETLIDLVHCI